MQETIAVDECVCVICGETYVDGPQGTDHPCYNEEYDENEDPEDVIERLRDLAIQHKKG